MFFPPPHVSSKLSWTMSELLRVEFKWHVGNKNTSNFNTISLAIWFGKARKIGYLKSVRIALQPCWEQWKKKKLSTPCWKGGHFRLTLACGVGRALAIAKGPCRTQTAVEESEVRDSERRRGTVFSPRSWTQRSFLSASESLPSEAHVEEMEGSDPGWQQGVA